MRVLISSDRPHPVYLKRLAAILVIAIAILWVGMYSIIFSGVFNRAAWASITAIETLR